jgi:hypothetical protein
MFEAFMDNLCESTERRVNETGLSVDGSRLSVNHQTKSPQNVDQDWQSAAVRRVIFLSAKYLSEPALIMGFKICSSA